MGYFITFLFIFGGVIFDGADVFINMDNIHWQSLYSYLRDCQFIGFSLLAFNICDYKKIEFKTMTFFMVLWRVFVTALNVFHGEPYYSPLFLVLLTTVYLTWIVKSLTMGKMTQAEEQPGAYVFYMPIHSFWGLLKAILNPWKGARYESVVVVNNRMVWAVNGREFVTRHIDDTDLAEKDGVKEYIGRNLTDVEISKLIHMVGKRAVPGIRDCRKLRVV